MAVQEQKDSFRADYSKTTTGNGADGLSKINTGNEVVIPYPAIVPLFRLSLEIRQIIYHYVLERELERVHVRLTTRNKPYAFQCLERPECSAFPLLQKNDHCTRESVAVFKSIGPLSLTCQQM